MDEIPFRLIFLILVVGGAILKPWIERRKKAYEEKKRLQKRDSSVNRTEAAEPEMEAQADDGPKLPYEDLVDEVFGPYMERRREAAKKAKAPEEPSRPAPAVVAEEAPPAPASAAQTELEVRRSETVSRIKPGAVEQASRTLPIDERIFGNRALSPMAKLVLAAEILQPPRSLRGRAGGSRR